LKRADLNGCGKLFRAAEPIEEYVKEAVCYVLDGVDVRSYLSKGNGSEEDGIIESIRSDEDKLADLAIDFADGKINKSEWYAIRDRLNARVEANRKAVAQANGNSILNGFVGLGEKLRASWSDYALDYQRSIIDAVIDHVEIAPAVKGCKTFDPSLITITFKF
jgi:hypothetical protein